jgi:proteasome lid subunit RPN8/RPN11
VEQNGKFNLIEAKNYSTDRSDNFEISPKFFYQTQKENKIVAIYHSHPRTPAQPSEIDKKVADSSLFPFIIYSGKDNDFDFYVPENSHFDKDKIKKILYEN